MTAPARPAIRLAARDGVALVPAPRRRGRNGSSAEHAAALAEVVAMEGRLTRLAGEVVGELVAIKRVRERLER